MRKTKQKLSDVFMSDRCILGKRVSRVYRFSSINSVLTKGGFV